MIEFAGLIPMALGGTLIGLVIKLLPGWTRRFINAAVQAALANWYRQGIAFAIQEIEGIDKNKTISLDVGSSGLAVVLRFLIDYAPKLLLKVSGGPDKVTAQILLYFTEHGIVLDQGSPRQLWPPRPICSPRSTRSAVTRCSRRFSPASKAGHEFGPGVGRYLRPAAFSERHFRNTRSNDVIGLAQGSRSLRCSACCRWRGRWSLSLVLLRQKKGEGLLAGALSLAGAVSMGSWPR